MRASVTGGRTAASSAGATLPARSARPSGTIRRGLPTPVNCGKASALTSLETGTSVPSRERAPRVPLLRVERGQQRSLTSPSAEYPQVCISARQQLDHRPTFQAGAHVESSAARASSRARRVVSAQVLWVPNIRPRR
jgi:hypothetical protein